MAQVFNIPLQRNEDRPFLWKPRVSLNLSGWTGEGQIKSRDDNTTIIDSVVFEWIAAEMGWFQTTFRASEGHPLATYGDPLQTINLPYDIRLISPSGIKRVAACGVVVLNRGVTLDV